MNKPAGRPRAADLEARNQHLIETAGQLFIAHGYSKVSLETIAREAHVAVRTIYVKFGGKTGLFSAVLVNNRDKFIAPHQLAQDQRPLKDIIRDFAEHFLDMVSTPAALAVQRMVIAEAHDNPDMASTFYEAGPRQTREMLMALFTRADIASQLRENMPLELLPSYLINCIMGDPFSRFLFDPAAQPRDEVLNQLHHRLELFFQSVLRQP